MLVALGFKIAAVPFHMWAPDAYEGAPTPVTAFMAAAVKAAALRHAHSPGLDGVRRAPSWPTARAAGRRLLVVLAVADDDHRQPRRAAPGQRQAHAGVLVDRARRVPARRCRAPSPSSAPRRAAPLVYYLVAYTFTTVGAFGVVAWIGSRGDERLMIDDWAGLGARHPGVALAMTIFMLSLGGIPPTAGFFGKFYVFRAALEKPALIWLVVIARAQQRAYRVSTTCASSPRCTSARSGAKRSRCARPASRRRCSSRRSACSSSASCRPGSSTSPTRPRFAQYARCALSRSQFVVLRIAAQSYSCIHSVSIIVSVVD